MRELNLYSPLMSNSPPTYPPIPPSYSFLLIALWKRTPRSDEHENDDADLASVSAWQRFSCDGQRRDACAAGCARRSRAYERLAGRRCHRKHRRASSATQQGGRGVASEIRKEEDLPGIFVLPDLFPFATRFEFKLQMPIHNTVTV